MIHGPNSIEEPKLFDQGFEQQLVHFELNCLSIWGILVGYIQSLDSIYFNNEDQEQIHIHRCLPQLPES